MVWKFITAIPGCIIWALLAWPAGFVYAAFYWFILYGCWGLYETWKARKNFGKIGSSRRGPE